MKDCRMGSSAGRDDYGYGDGWAGRVYPPAWSKAPLPLQLPG